MSILFGLILLPISISDLSERRIPNIYTKILGLLMLIEFIICGLPAPQIGLGCAFLVLVLGLLKVGMGDIKLISILILTFNLHLIPFLSYLLAAAMVHIVISTARYRVMPLSIPLAPAIFFGFSTYLATGSMGYLQE
jgi:Flp pilus assembly protein protease CpaA